MSKMLLMLWLPINLANAQSHTETVQGCGVQPDGTQQAAVFVQHDNKHTGIYISPQHYLITYKSSSGYNQEECEKEGKDASKHFPGKKATFIGDCAGLHGFFLVQDTNLNQDWFACLPTERVANDALLQIIMPPPEDAKLVKVVECSGADAKDARKICLTPPEKSLGQNGNLVIEKQGDLYTIHGIGIWDHGPHGEIVSVFRHLQTICELMGRCGPPTTIPPSTSEALTSATVPDPTSAVTPPPLTPRDPPSTAPSVTSARPMTFPTSSRSVAPSVTPASPANKTSLPKPRTQKKMSKVPVILTTTYDPFEGCDYDYICVYAHHWDAKKAEGNGILIAIALILVMLF